MCVCSDFSSHNSGVHNILRCVSLCRDIMLLSNTVIYDHQLQAGSSTVAMATLYVPHWSSTLQSEGDVTDGPSVDAKKTEFPHWLCYAVDPSHPVVFVDTDKVGVGWKEGRQKTHCITISSLSNRLTLSSCCLLDVSCSQLQPPIFPCLSLLICSSFSTTVPFYTCNNFAFPQALLFPLFPTFAASLLFCITPPMLFPSSFPPSLHSPRSYLLQNHLPLAVTSGMMLRLALSPTLSEQCFG